MSLENWARKAEFKIVGKNSLTKLKESKLCQI
jgi:hypothetical protein